MLNIMDFIHYSLYGINPPTPCASKQQKYNFCRRHGKIALHFDIVTYNGVLTRIFFTGVHRTHREAKRGS